MTRCGTCWASLKEGESVEEHSATSAWHAEMTLTKENGTWIQ